MPLFAAVRVADGQGSTPEALSRAGHVLAGYLSQLPGFVSFVLVWATDGTVVSVSIHEDAASLAEADREVAAWAGAGSVEARPSLAPVITGEIIVQRGL